MKCTKTDCMHYDVCMEWISLGAENYIDDSCGNCDHYKPDINSVIDDIYPLVVVEDRYSGVYSGGIYLAFNMDAETVGCLPIDAGDTACADFWDNEANQYVIGKGSTPYKAILDLVNKLNN